MKLEHQLTLVFLGFGAIAFLAGGAVISAKPRRRCVKARKKLNVQEGLGEQEAEKEAQSHCG